MAFRHGGRHEPKEIDARHTVGALAIRNRASLSVHVLRQSPQIIEANSGRGPVFATTDEWPYALFYIIGSRELAPAQSAANKPSAGEAISWGGVKCACAAAVIVDRIIVGFACICIFSVAVKQDTTSVFLYASSYEIVKDVTPVSFQVKAAVKIRTRARHSKLHFPLILCNRHRGEADQYHK